MGALAVILAVAVLMTSSNITDIANWAREVLGWTFVGLLGGLVFLALFSWVRMMQSGNGQSEIWFEAGVQAANGVTTLALTFTLLGISLGIGTLASSLVILLFIPAVFALGDEAKQRATDLLATRSDEQLPEAG